MLNPHPNLTEGVIHGLGWLYFILFLMNTAWSVRAYRLESRFHESHGHGAGDGEKPPSTAVWGIYSSILLLMSFAHFAGASNPDTFILQLPNWIRVLVNKLADPVSYFALSMILFVGMVAFRRALVKPTVAWVLLNVSIVFLGFSLTDFNFRQIVGKPDNVPIVAMLFIVAYFTWLYFKRAIDNDDRIAQGRPLFEQEKNEKVLVWPDLVYTELICMIGVTALLVLWGVALPAPLEEPANAAATPNPSKAPWYFLGLQEMLVYFDPWLAGVVLPSLIIVGLMAIPYIDFNKRGNGYYSFEERKFAILTFLFGFLPLWVAMIILGTFLRGPNWNFFGIYEYWDVHKLEAANNVNLSEYFWIKWLGSSLPAYDPNNNLQMLLAILKREFLGILVVIGYFLVLPPLGAATVFRKFYLKMGFIRYIVFAILVLSMASLPIKMLLRWTVSLKYIVAIPEYFFNI